MMRGGSGPKRSRNLRRRLGNVELRHDCTEEPMEVVGVDAFKGKWVAAVLRQGRFAGVTSGPLAVIAAAHPAAMAIAVDIPIGVPASGSRGADIASRSFVGPKRASSVFPTPPRWALDCLSYEEVRAEAKQRNEKGVTAQAFALKDLILEAEKVAAQDPRVFEIHPEVSFAAMASNGLRFGKKCWGGFHERRGLLEQQGIHIPISLGAGDEVGLDDVLDAFAAAWSANRKALGAAQSLPPNPPVDGSGREIAIWY